MDGDVYCDETRQHHPGQDGGKRPHLISVVLSDTEFGVHPADQLGPHTVTRSHERLDPVPQIRGNVGRSPQQEIDSRNDRAGLAQGVDPYSRQIGVRFHNRIQNGSAAVQQGPAADQINSVDHRCPLQYRHADRTGPFPHNLHGLDPWLRCDPPVHRIGVHIHHWFTKMYRSNIQYLGTAQVAGNTHNLNPVDVEETAPRGGKAAGSHHNHQEQGPGPPEAPPSLPYGSITAHGASLNPTSTVSGSRSTP